MELSAWLDRHEVHRGLDRPTVSVLAGPVALGSEQARAWARSRGRSVVEVADPRAEVMAGAWVNHVVTGRDLTADAIVWLARKSGMSADNLGPRLARISRVEREIFLASALPDLGSDGPESTCRAILDRPDLTRPIDRAGLGVVPLVDLIPPGEGPVLIVAEGSSGPDPSGWFEIASRSVARLAMSQPRLSTIVVVSLSVLDGCLGQIPESREKALIRSGVIAVLDRPETETELAKSPSVSPQEQADEQARSAAERFLFDRLESRPSTAGRFALNADLAIRFGVRSSMEVDLLAVGPKIAVEIDGYYHFLNEDAYRRDRRKDFLLQTHGYLVIRVLAVDVVPRLEEILNQISAAITSRDARP